MERTLRTSAIKGTGALLALASLLAPLPALAHLMPAQQGTLNVAGDSVFSVIAVPVSALHGFDDDGDGLLGTAELERHHAELEAEVDRRFVVRAGEARGKTELVNLILSPQHDASPDRADGIVALVHTRFARAPEELAVSCDLFGAGGSERRLTLKATRRRDAVEDAESVVLTPEATEHAFFAPPARTWASRLPAGARLLLVLLVACGLGWRYGVGAVARVARRRSVRPT